MRVGQVVQLRPEKIKRYRHLKCFSFVVVGFVSANLIDEMVDVQVLAHDAFIRSGMRFKTDELTGTRYPFEESSLQ